MNRWSLLAALVLVCPLVAQPLATGGEPQHRLLLPAADPTTLGAALEARGYDVLGTHPLYGGLEVITSAADTQALQNAGLAPRVLETAEGLHTKFQREGLPTGYLDLAGIQAAMQALQAQRPDLVTLHDLAAEYGPGSTFEGRGIPCIRISDNASVDEDEPEILFVSAHHCREIVTPVLALDIATRLIQGHGVDPQLTALVDGHEIWIAPVWNPDGYDYVWTTNNLWRKNRKPVAAGTLGVDLNRNYALGWDAPCGGNTNPSSETYRGPSAESEEETQTMVAFSRARRFAKVMDYHSHGREVLLTYTCSPMPAVIESFIDAEGTILAGLVPTPPGYATRAASAEGENYQWQIQEITSYAYLTETATSFQPLYNDALNEAALLWPQTMGFLQRPIPVVGHVLEVGTGLPVEAEITVAGVDWLMGETRHSEPVYGRYHLWLPPGTYDVTFRAAGRNPVTDRLVVPANATLTHDVTVPEALNLVATSTGGGVGDLFLELQGVPTQAFEGYTLISGTTTQPLGLGFLFGLVPDQLTLTALATPAAAGNPLHFPLPATPGYFPDQPFLVPPGGLVFPAGTSVDAVALVLLPPAEGWRVSPPVRVQF